MRIFITFLLLSLCTLHAKSDTTRIEFYYGIAEGNYLIGDLKGAANGVEQMLKLDPDYVPALTLNTRIKIDEGESEVALVSAEHAISIEPNNLEHLLLKALVMGNMNRRDDAIDLIEQVMETAPIDSDDYRVASKLLGLLLMAEGNWDTAAETFNQIYLDNPETATISLKLASEAYLEKAGNALNKGDTDAAVDAITQALEVHENQSGETSLKQRTSLRMMRARVLTQAGRVDEAIEDLQLITNQQPNNLEAFVTLASLYASAERWESLQGIIAPIAEKPELKDIALYLEGRAALAKGRAGTARQKFESALRLLPDGSSKLRSSLEFYHGVCYHATGRKADGNFEILKALDSEFRPETTEEAILASRAFIQSKQAERAIPILEALTLNQDAPTAETWALLGRAHQIEKTYALAISAYNEAIQMDSNNPETRAARGSLLRTIGDLEGATSDYLKALKAAPNNAGYAYALGLTYFQQGQLIKAEQHIGSAANTLQENAGIQLLHGLLAYTIDKPTVAKQALSKYFELSAETPNETALYLEYSLQVQEDLSLAILALNQRLNSRERSDCLKKFILYNIGQLDRKAIIDHAGIAETPQIAKQQISEAAFWIAQHERAIGNTEAFYELLELINNIGHPDISEWQLARWQLQSKPDDQSPKP